MPINNQITGGNFTDASGAPLANGYLVFQLSQDEQSPAPGQITAGRKIQVTLDSSGNVPASPAVFMFANDSLNPANSYYKVSAYAANGQLVWGPQNQQVLSSPSPFNLNAWVPNSINTSSTPAPTIQLQTNEVMNGSQTLLDLHAGSGISLTDNGAGRVTVAASGSGGTVLTAGAAASAAGGTGSPATLALNVSTEGTVDWWACNQGPASSIGNFESTTPYTWKKNGVNRGKFTMVALDSGDGIGATPQIGNQTASPLLLTASAGDAARPFSNNPNRNCGLVTCNTSGNVGAGAAIRLWGDGLSHTYKFYVNIGNFSDTVTVTAHADDGSTADAVLSATETIGGAVWSFTFTAKIPASSSITVSAVVTTNNGTFAGAGFQAVTVF
jgi:hypothetical protein